MTTCNDIQRKFLDHDWDQAALHDAAAILSHLEQCGECRMAVGQFEQLRSLLRIPGPVPEPPAAVAVQPELLRRVGRLKAVERVAWGTATAVSLALGILVAGIQAYLLHGPLVAAAPPKPAAVNSAPASTGSLAATPWTGADIKREVQLFDNVSETFDGRASWVAVGDRGSELGLMPASAGKQGKLLLLRLAMSQGQREQSRTDLVIVPGQGANLDVPLGAGQVLHYNIAAPGGKDRRLSLWAEVRSRRDDGETLAALATSLKPVSGQVFSAGRLVTAAGSYNLEVSFDEKDRTQAMP
ncbi:MAG: anti-sigma factor family protein [Thermoguttaceae bacterium]